MMRVAAIYDIHANLPALEAVLQEIRQAGSVGMPFGEPGAHWLPLGPAVEPRHTLYDLAAAANRIRATGSSRSAATGSTRSRPG